MEKRDNNRRFRLHFEGPSTSEHTLRASALIKALQGFQRVVHLLAVGVEGKEVQPRTLLDIESRFPVLCDVPESGGYALPVYLGDPGHKRFDAKAVDRLARLTRDVFTAVNQGDEGTLEDLVPDPDVQQSVLRAVRSIQSPKLPGVVVNIEDFRNKKLLDGTAAKAPISDLLRNKSFAFRDSIGYVSREPEQVGYRKLPPVADASDQSSFSLGMTEAPEYVVGTLAEVQSKKRFVRIQLPSGRTLKASYSENFEPVLLLRHPQQLLQIHGKISYGDDGLPLSISDVDEIVEVDASPIEVRAISFDSQLLRAREPLVFSVSFERNEQTYEARGPFDILVFGTTRRELEAELYAELVMLWHEYATAEPDSLTKAARDLREHLRQMFEGYANAT